MSGVVRIDKTPHVINDQAPGSDKGDSASEISIGSEVNAVAATGSHLVEGETAASAVKGGTSDTPTVLSSADITTTADVDEEGEKQEDDDSQEGAITSAVIGGLAFFLVVVDGLVGACKAIGSFFAAPFRVVAEEMAETASDLPSITGADDAQTRAAMPQQEVSDGELPDDTSSVVSGSSESVASLADADEEPEEVDLREYIYPGLGETDLDEQQKAILEILSYVIEGSDNLDLSDYEDLGNKEVPEIITKALTLYNEARSFGRFTRAKEEAILSRIKTEVFQV